MAGTIVNVKQYDDYILQIYDVYVVSQWYNGSYIDCNADDVNTGFYNTPLIVTAQGGGSYAARICDVATNGGKSDWYLPSNEELTAMYQKGLLNSSETYWSSTEIDSNLAYSINGSTGVFSQSDKSISTYVAIKTRKEYTTTFVTIDKMKLQSKNAPILRGGENNADEDVYKMLGGVNGISKNSNILSNE